MIELIKFFDIFNKYESFNYIIKVEPDSLDVHGFGSKDATVKLCNNILPKLRNSLEYYANINVDEGMSLVHIKLIPLVCAA
mgnify:CR=1 FL=1